MIVVSWQTQVLFDLIISSFHFFLFLLCTCDLFRLLCFCFLFFSVRLFTLETGFLNGCNNTNDGIFGNNYHNEVNYDNMGNWPKRKARIQMKVKPVAPLFECTHSLLFLFEFCF